MQSTGVPRYYGNGVLANDKERAWFGALDKRAFAFACVCASASASTSASVSASAPERATVDHDATLRVSSASSNMNAHDG